MLVTQYLGVVKEYVHLYIYMYIYIYIYNTHTHTHTHGRGSGAHDAGDAVPGRPEGVRAKALTISFFL